jgi:choline dehydrogenase-like flavoprotein
MDRQIAKAGTLVPASPAGLRSFTFYDMRRMMDQHVLGKLTLRDQILESEGLLGNLVSFSPKQRHSLYHLAERPFGRGTTSRSPAQASLRALRAGWRQRRLPSNVLRHVRNIATGVDDLIYIRVLRRMSYRPEFNFDDLGWHVVHNAERRFSSLEVHQMCEQSPDFDNRITLSDARDATGMPMARVAFRWNVEDISSIVRTQDILKQEFARSSIGDLRVDRRRDLPVLAQMSAHHPAGTTRMASDPKHGVVDANCKVHGLSNLFIASSSVFPTSGCVPPTLTILALAIRVADQVKAVLAKAEGLVSMAHGLPRPFL